MAFEISKQVSPIYVSKSSMLKYLEMITGCDFSSRKSVSNSSLKISHSMVSSPSLGGTECQPSLLSLLILVLDHFFNCIENKFTQ